MRVRTILSKVWYNIQYQLFPLVEEEYGFLSEKHKKLVSVLEVIRIEEFIHRGSWMGRPLQNRAALARSFIAKCIFNFSYTNQLIDKLKYDKVLRRICGWDNDKIPSESTFSRAFAEFSECNLAERVHESLVIDMYKGEVIGHIIKDSTPILGREKVARKKKAKQIRKSKAKIQNPNVALEKLPRIQRQASGRLTFDQMLDELPKQCDIGKKKSNGIALCWKGYKLHLSADDNCIPIAAIITSASVHDSQVGIPLAIKTKQRVNNFYDLMDSAYYTEEILSHSHSLGHIPIVDFCPRTANQKIEKDQEKERRQILNWEPAESRRYYERMPKERVNALFKETCGGRAIRYKGIKKVSSQVMFNLLTITATLLLSLAQ